MHCSVKYNKGLEDGVASQVVVYHTQYSPDQYISFSNSAPSPQMAPSKSPGPVDALIVNIPEELEPKGSGGSVIISQPKNSKPAASGEANPKA